VRRPFRENVVLGTRSWLSEPALLHIVEDDRWVIRRINLSKELNDPREMKGVLRTNQHQTVVHPAAGNDPERRGDPVMGDLIEFVDFNYVAMVARLNAATLATLAASPGRPGKVAIDTTKLENGTTFHWEPAPGKVDHYELLWRDTIAFDWQFVQSIPPPDGAPVNLTVPVSKDNVIFGVRAVDAAGHRGLVVAP